MHTTTIKKGCIKISSCLWKFEEFAAGVVGPASASLQSMHIACFSASHYALREAKCHAYLSDALSSGAVNGVFLDLIVQLRRCCQHLHSMQPAASTLHKTDAQGGVSEACMGLRRSSAYALVVAQAAWSEQGQGQTCN